MSVDVQVFDCTNYNTFQSAAKWKADIEEHCKCVPGYNLPVILLANKVFLTLPAFNKVV